MKNIRPLLETSSPEDARSALYYLNRYLKQASTFDNYGKDLFADDVNSQPNDKVRELTIVLIDFIENQEGRRASTFEDSLYLAWANHVNAVERELDPEPSADTVKKALDFIDAMGAPSIKS